MAYEGTLPSWLLRIGRECASLPLDEERALRAGSRGGEERVRERNVWFGIRLRVDLTHDEKWAPPMGGTRLHLRCRAGREINLCEEDDALFAG